MLTIDTIPLQTFPIFDCQLPIDVLAGFPHWFQLAIGNRQSEMSLRFLVSRVLTTTATKLLKLKPIRRGLLILRRHVVAALAVTTLEHNIIAWHLVISDCRLPIAD